MQSLPICNVWLHLLQHLYYTISGLDKDTSEHSPQPKVVKNFFGLGVHIIFAEKEGRIRNENFKAKQIKKNLDKYLPLYAHNKKQLRL